MYSQNRELVGTTTNQLIVDSYDLCDICMKKIATFDFSCAKHRICRNFKKKTDKREYPENCPFCGPLVIREMEKQVGKLYITSSTYIPTVIILPSFSESVSTSQATKLRSRETTITYELKQANSILPTEQDDCYEFDNESLQLSNSVSLQESTSAYGGRIEDQELFSSYSFAPIQSISTNDLSYFPLSQEQSSFFIPVNNTNSLISG